MVVVAHLLIPWFTFGRVFVSSFSTHAKHVQKITFGTFFVHAIDSLREKTQASHNEKITLNIDVLASMEKLLLDLNPSSESSHRKIFAELLEELKYSHDGKVLFPPSVLLELFFYFSSQKDRTYLMGMVIDRLSGRLDSHIKSREHTHHDLMGKFQLLVGSTIFSIMEAHRLFLSYMFNSLKWFEMPPHSDVQSISHLHQDSELFYPQERAQAITTGTSPMDPRSRPFFKKEDPQPTALSSMLHASMKIISEFFKITKSLDSIFDTPLDLKCWELASIFLVTLHPLDMSAIAFGRELLSYFGSLSFSKFDRLPLETKVQIVELVSFIKSDQLKDALLLNVILPYFSGSYMPTNAQEGDVDFSFILVSKIFKLLTGKTMQKFLTSFIQNVTNDNCSIFSILTLDQRMRLEQALFIGSQRILSETPDRLAQFLNLYSALGKSYARNTSSASLYVSTVDFAMPIYKWNSHALLPIYGLFGYNAMMGFLHTIPPSLFAKDPRITIHALSLLFSFPSPRLTEGCEALIEKLQLVSEEDLQTSYRRDGQDISGTHARSIIKDICRSQVALKERRSVAKLQFKNVFPDVLFRENLPLASICSFLTDHGRFVLLVEFLEKHPFKTSFVGTLYRAMMFYCYKQKHLFSYCALLKRLLEAESIDIFIESHQSHLCSVRRSFYQNVLALLMMNDPLLLLIYLKRLSVCARLLNRLNGQLVSFINESILTIDAGYSKTAINIPYYLGLRFCRENIFSRKLKSIGMDRFFSIQAPDISFYDLAEKLEEITHLDFLSPDEKEILSDTLRKKPYMVKIMNALKTLKENKVFIL